jgi:hypothetical protein
MAKFLVKILGLMAALAVRGHCQVLVYNQPSGASPYGYGGHASGGIWTATYDDFVLPTSGQITGLSWAGFFPPENMNGLDNGYISAFNIVLCADSSGQPGATLYSATIAGNGNETLSTVNTHATYDYSVSLPSPFSAAGGVKYWLSVQPSLTYSQPFWYWYWMTGFGGDGVSYQSGNAWYEDLTFGIYSIPEPRPLALILLGCSIWIWTGRSSLRGWRARCLGKMQVES